MFRPPMQDKHLLWTQAADLLDVCAYCRSIALLDSWVDSMQVAKLGLTHAESRWQADHEATHCPVCQAAFGMFQRKHHCRRCGRVFCGSCCGHRITLGSSDKPERACAACASAVAQLRQQTPLLEASGGLQATSQSMRAVADAIPSPRRPSQSRHG